MLKKHSRMQKPAAKLFEKYFSQPDTSILSGFIIEYQRLLPQKTDFRRVRLFLHNLFRKPSGKIQNFLKILPLFSRFN